MPQTSNQPPAVGRSGHALIVLFALSLLCPATFAQSSGEPLESLADSALGPLHYPVSLQADSLPLEAVLREIADKAGLRLVFNTDLAAAQPVRSLRLDRVPAREALLRALEDSPLVALRLPDGKILIIERPSAAPAGGARETTDQPHHTVRGRIFDRDSRFPLPGANVIVVGSDPLIGTTSDASGSFVLDHVPLGRQDIQVSFIGYEPRLLTGILVTSGKEAVLEIALKEQILRGQEIVIRPQVRKDLALNEMATVSARTFSVEETRRFAGGADDPARMAASFAGVAGGAGVQDNALVIRGNAPKGVQWRLEGVEIPNPNHFAGMTVAGGGGLTLFSGHLLADSDFYTGAFPAEFGNALAGVFDMRFRSGNPTRREHAVQVGVMGIDLSSEGPFALGSPSTYLFNYRYSTIGLLLPLLPTEDVATYQDLSFKFTFPSRKAGRLEWWGIGGLDRQSMTETSDSTEWRYDLWDRVRFDLGLDVGASGLSHHLVLGERTYLRTSAAVTLNRTRLDQDRLSDDLELEEDLYLHSRSGRLILGSYLNHKFSARHVNRTGFTAQRLFYDLDLRSALDREPPMTPLSDEKGASMLLQAYSQSRIEPAHGITVNLGLHALHFALTGNSSLEPRLGLRWALNNRHAVSIGYGLHGQMEELRMYLLQKGLEMPNRKLDFTRSHQMVLGYDLQVASTTRLKWEAYAQSLFRVPVVTSSSTSLLNFEQDWSFSDGLRNVGAGRNFGFEMTAERFFDGGLYFLVTGSLFRSRYRGGDDVWRPTRFDRGYTVNGLVGREFQYADGKQILGLNGRIAAMGGKRRSPVDETTSLERQEVVLDEARAFEDREPGLFLLDLTATYRLNRRRLSHVWALQVKNTLAAREVSLDYNYRTRMVEEVRDGYPLPVLSYKIEF